MKLFTISLFLLIGIVAIGQSTPIDMKITNWEQFKTFYNKEYSSPEEEAKRKENFMRSLKFVKENEKNPHGIELSINEMSDLNDFEFEGRTLGRHGQKVIEHINSTKANTFEEYSQFPRRFDWRDRVPLSPIENQGQCGSCYSFATTFTVEALRAYKKNSRIILSKQELVDCSKPMVDSGYNNQGCKYGYPLEAYKYIMKKGVHGSDDYPYNGNPNEGCYKNRLRNRPAYRIDDYGRYDFNTNDESIMYALLNYGPVSVVIHGTSNYFRHYRGGIMRNILSFTQETNHVVALIGWGTENGIDYWVLRNSWGTGWGEQGYARVERHHNLLGLNNWVTYPIIH